MSYVDNINIESVVVKLFKIFGVDVAVFTCTYF